MATYAQRLLEAATLMRSSQGGGSLNQGLTVIVTAEADTVLVKDPFSSVNQAEDGWVSYAGNAGVTAYGLPQIP